MTDKAEPPPANQLADFDQTHAELNAWVDKFVEAHREVRAENTSPREIDIAGLSEWLQSTTFSRRDFAELLTAAVVRLAGCEEDR